MKFDVKITFKATKEIFRKQKTFQLYKNIFLYHLSVFHGVLLVDEIYFQKASQYQGGEYIGVDSEGNLYKSFMTFKIHKLKKPVPFVIKAVLEIKKFRKYGFLNILMKVFIQSKK